MNVWTNAPASIELRRLNLLKVGVIVLLVAFPGIVLSLENNKPTLGLPLFGPPIAAIASHTFSAYEENGQRG